MTRFLMRCVSVSFGLLLSAAACSSDKKAPPAAGAPSDGCLVNSDCAAPLVCAFQRCHVECVTTRDCDGTLRCVGAQEASRVCQLEVEATCKTTADCPPGLVCGSDGECRDHCLDDGECIGEQVCQKGACAEPSELDASGQLPSVIPFPPCRLNSDCAEGQRCTSGSCVAQCVSDRDCAPGEACAEGACERAVADECQSDAQCNRAGSSCVAGECRCQCLADIDCAAGETCDGCACQAPPPPECENASDCDDGEQCVDGACLCGCVEDRDCATGLLCVDCRCVAPPPVTTIHDATLKDATDVLQMRGIKDVEATLRLTIGLTDTVGLEALESVGSLELFDLVLFSTGGDLFTGLANLTTIRQDLTIQNLPTSQIQLNPALKIGGKVTIKFTQLSCASLGALQANLEAQGFKGSFEAMYNGGCPGSCSHGTCFFVP